MGTWQILSSTLVGGVVSAFVPLMSAEVLVLSAVTLGPRGLAFPCVLLVTVGQMIGKCFIYLAGRGAGGAKWIVPVRKMERAGALVRNRGGTSSLLLFASASAGFPPFYLTTVACGMLRIRFLRFVALGFLGRLIRFSALGMFPQLAQGRLP